MSAALTIGNVTIPFKYKGYNLSKNKVWSENTRRNNNAEMVGTIVAIKRKITGTLVPITPSQAAILDSVLSSRTSFMTVTYLDVDGTYKTMQAYLGDVTYPFLGTNIDGHGKTLITDVEVSVIEK